MKTRPVRYPEIEVAGTPRQMGRQLGEAAADEIRGFTEIALESVQKTIRISQERAMDVVLRSLAMAEQYDDQIVEELRGIADVTGIVPPSPAPFTPRGFRGVGLSMWTMS